MSFCFYSFYIYEEILHPFHPLTHFLGVGSSEKTRGFFHQSDYSPVQSICTLGYLAQVMRTNSLSLGDFWFRSYFWRKSYILLRGKAHTYKKRVDISEMIVVALES
ncbi:hypothetical protein RIF29_27963 [Crotalaria pallida]|uniref:Uncharacterized protein n=1 Tax=Crotalaria pallida TaxID=3830 RepID=A0AAN9EQ21_CROPI